MGWWLDASSQCTSNPQSVKKTLFEALKDKKTNGRVTVVGRTVGVAGGRQHSVRDKFVRVIGCLRVIRFSRHRARWRQPRNLLSLLSVFNSQRFYFQLLSSILPPSLSRSLPSQNVDNGPARVHASPQRTGSLILLFYTNHRVYLL